MIKQGLVSLQRRKVAGLFLLWIFCLLSFSPLTLVSAAPVCASANSDGDGDGYGWENGETCLVSAPPQRDQLPLCTDPLADPDGDGFGWESNASCRVSAPTSARPRCQLSASDPDGDGFGWENNTTCIAQYSGTPAAVISAGLLREEKVTLRTPACSDFRFDTDGDGYGWENSRSCTFFNAGDGGRNITDVILVTGQSNALGAESGRMDPLGYDPDLDSSVRRVYSFSKSGWGIAGLRQIWDLDWYPRGDIGGPPANNFAFHFGKNLVRRDASAVIGIIMITAPGEAIDHWNRNSDFFAGISNKVQLALDALPGEQKVRGILWHQGESDYNADDYYSDRLRNLISDFRSQNWFAEDGVFICGETLNSPVNERLSRLNSDGDSLTGCVPSTGLVSVGDDVHFNAQSLRTLGARYADKYQSLAR